MSDSAPTSAAQSNSRLTTLLRRLEMPLLVVELKDLAWRPRTYVVRFVYAFVLFAVACSLFYGNLTQGQSDSLGRGRLIFLQFLQIQFWVIVLFLPALRARSRSDCMRATISVHLVTSACVLSSKTTKKPLGINAETS